MKLIFIYLPIILAISQADLDSEWNQHAECGAESNPNQSPVKITSSAAVYDAEKSKVEFAWGEENDASVIVVDSNGETAYIGGDFKQTLNVDGVKFNLDYVVFHWGEKGAAGSEHKIDDETFHGEIEFIHSKEGSSSIDEAKKVPGSFVVVSLLLKLDSMRKIEGKDEGTLMTTSVNRPLFDLAGRQVYKNFQ